MKTGEIQFCHLRYFGEKGEVLGKGGQTIAYRVSPANEDGVFTIEVAKSICCDKDMFWRKRGREIAAARLGSTVEPTFFGEELVGKIETRHTLNEDIHNTISNWAYGV